MDASGDLALGVRRLGAGLKVQGSGIQGLGVHSFRESGFQLCVFGVYQNPQSK